METWFILAEEYLAKAIPIIEENYGALKALFKGKLDAPAAPDYHPELDSLDFLNDNETRLYQSYVGILRWAIELGRIDLAHTGATMATFMAAPRKGHIVAMLRVFAFLRKHISCKLVVDPRERDWSNKIWISANWKEFYPDIKEDLPSNAPKPRGKSIQLNMFCDASHATNLVTRRFTTGIIIFLNGTPVKWYSKRQNTIDSSTFGSEFVALKIAAEMNDAMHYKVCMLGIPISEATKTFCDNNSVVLNVKRPESTLQKKQNSIAYHKNRECVAMEAMRIHHEPGTSNLADFLTKWLPPHKHLELCCCML